MTQEVLRAVDLSKSFDGKKYLFQNLSLDLRPGDHFFLKGKSGSGKTLFLKALTLLTEVQSGRILWGEKEIEQDSIPLFRSEVHFLGQSPTTFQGTVLEFFKDPWLFDLNKKKKWDIDRIIHYLNELDFSKDFLEKRVPFLSGGEKQLIKLLRSLLLNPKGLLLDEPTSSMDNEMRIKVERFLLKIQKEFTMFILWVSHNNEHFSAYGKNTLHFPSLKKEDI